MYDQAPFTVKWLSEDGHVFLLPACAITPGPCELPGELPDGGLQLPAKRMEFDRGAGSGVRSSIDSGVVYALNQNGKTVDTIHFPLRSTD